METEPRQSASGPACAAPGPPDERSVFRTALGSVRRQVIAGLLLVLPFLATFWIVSKLYTTLEDFVIAPTARLVIFLIEGRTGVELPPWIANYVAPLLGIVGVILVLYFLGALARSRLARVIDYLLLRVPVVKVIHNAVSRVFQSLKGQGELTRFKRVVLVSFPHPGMRVPGFVTSSCRDVDTQKTILCVYIPTTPVPTSGYMLLIPEEEVTELDWDLEETIQAVVSFGITAPDRVRYYTDGSAVGNVPGSRTSATPDSKANGTS
jgi:uncharacterized membrane protein